MIAQETIDRIRDAANLVEIISETITLKRSGSGYFGLCPFHQEKTGSFHVREDGNSYHCFGCGASGNAFSYIMETRGMSFPEAVEYLAAHYNIEIKHEGKNSRSLNSTAPLTKLYELHAVAQQYFQQSLLRAKDQVSTYLQQRGIRKDTITEFGIGFAPDLWQGLQSQFQKKNYSNELVLQSGLCRGRTGADPYDTFRARLIFPIWLDQKRICGFGGRFIPEFSKNKEGQENTPKYINSPESPIYRKSKTFYGFPQALPTLRKEKYVYLVEGYMDVISLWQAGVKNVLATCGTAVTGEHAKKLSGIVNEVVILFDGDNAGRAAAGKSFMPFRNSGIDTRALFLPAGEDPDDFARKHGEGTVEALKNLKSVPLFDCYLDTVFSNHGVVDSSSVGAALSGKIGEEVAKVLREIRNDIERDELFRRLAFRLGVDQDVILRVASGFAPISPVNTTPEQNQLIAASNLTTVERQLLVAVMGERDSLPEQFLQNADICSIVRTPVLHFVESMHEVMKSAAGDQEKKEGLRALLEKSGKGWTELWKEAFQMKKDESIDLRQVFQECLRHLRRDRLTGLMRELRTRLERSNSGDERKEIESQIMQVMQQRAALYAPRQ